MIICAAIQFIVNKTGRVVTMCGHRHGDIFSQMAGLGLSPGKDYTEVCQGFMTSSGDFLDRYGAYNEALNCGQLSTTTKQAKRDAMERELYSEDLY